MTRKVRFLTVEQVLAIHARVVAEFGGDPSVRDRGLAESATAMPLARFGGAFLHEDLPAMAAAYLFHLCRNHPFVDGNKRAALAAALVFLMATDAQLSASDAELEGLTLGVADGSVVKEQVVAFFRRHVVL